MAPRIDGRVGSKKERKQIFYLMRRKIWKVKENGVGAADDDGPTDQRMSQRRLLHGGQKRTRNGTASGAKKKGGKDRISSFFGTSLAIGVAYSTNAFQWPVP